MNIMDKPTIAEIKEKYKNAKEVKSVNGYIFDYTKISKFYEMCGDIYAVDANGKSRTLFYNSIIQDKYAEIISYKEPFYQLTAKEIVHAYEKPQYLKDTFKECFETELEVGKWYIRKHNRKCIINFQLDNNTNYGFGALGNYSVGWQLDEENSIDFEPATKKEVEEALQSEWIKRAEKEGYTCITLDGITLKECRFTTKFKDNKLYLDSSLRQCIFNDGKWAEIITPTYTIQEAEEKFNIKIKAV